MTSPLLTDATPAKLLAHRPFGLYLGRGDRRVRAIASVVLSLAALGIAGAADTISVVIRISLVPLAMPERDAVDASER